ncbi:MAG: PilZ domain-containing protein [Cellvibrionaceae bacterium]
MNTEKNVKDKRSFFRVDKELILDYKSVDAYTAENETAAEQFDDPMPMHLFSKFNQLDRQASQLLQLISKDNKAIADYLKIVNKKIGLLSQEVIAMRSPTKSATTKVNLSEAGIGFIADKPIYKGSHIALRMVFLPDYSGVSFFGEVIRSEPMKGELHHIAIKFQNIDESDRQLLSKQIMQAQLVAKRRAAAK